MRLLVKLNLAAGLLVAAALAAYVSDVPFADLVLFLILLPILGILFLAAIGSGLMNWRLHRMKALWPLGSFVASYLLGVALGMLGGMLVVRLQGSPDVPERFLSGTRKAELTRVAMELLQRESSAFRVPSGQPLRMLTADSGRGRSVPAAMLRQLDANRIAEVWVDTERGLVMLVSFRRRMAHRYVYARGAILDRLPSPEVTEASIRDWAVLIDIARGGDRTDDIGGDWRAAHAELERAVGRPRLERLKAYASVADVTEDDKHQVLAGFNRLLAVDSGLSERAVIRSFASGDWVPRMAEILFRENAVRRSATGQHFVASDLAPGARRRVEWLHYGLLCSTLGGFGGLMHRMPYLADDYLLDRALAASSRPLGDGWFHAY